MLKLSNRDMAMAAMIAAIYFVLGIVFAPISFGNFQMRVAEALTLLCIFSPAAVWGVTVGCVLTNAYGIVSGATILGVMDVFLGSAATLLAGYLSWKLAQVRIASLPVAAAIPPILVNAVVIGGELAFATTGALFNWTHLIFGVEVGVGQLASCAVLGLILVATLERTGLAKRIFGTAQSF